MPGKRTLSLKFRISQTGPGKVFSVMHRTPCIMYLIALSLVRRWRTEIAKPMQGIAEDAQRMVCV